MEPRDAMELLGREAFPWWVAGGWALDVFLASPIRPRKDLDIALLRRDAGRLRSHLAGWDIRVAVPGGGLSEWAGAALHPPLHELWARPSPGVPWVCEFLLNDATNSRWLYRRDPRITYPLDRLARSGVDDIRFLPPEIVLL